MNHSVNNRLRLGRSASGRGWAQGEGKALNAQSVHRRAKHGGAVTDEGPRNLYAYAGCEDLTLEGPDDFAFAITSGDDRVINFCLYGARKQKILVPLFERLKQTAPSMQTREAFHRAWIGQGLYIREDFAVDPLLLDVLRNFLPGKPDILCSFRAFPLLTLERH